LIERLRARVFYGWFMVASGFGIQLLVSALINQGYGAYVVVLQKEMGWSKTALSAGYALSRLENGILGPIDGWLSDRFGPRNMVRFGMVTFAVGLMLLSLTNTLAAFYGALVVVTIGASLGSFLPLNVAIVHWFRRRRASAMAVMSMGFAVGGFIVPVIAFSLEHVGWRETAFASGVVVLLVGLPLSQVIRNRPELYGEVPDGIREAARVDQSRPPIDESGVDFTARQALRTPAFWLVSLGHASALLVVSAVVVHLLAHLNENLGYSLGTAGLVFALMTAMQLVGMISGGFLGDRFSKRLICAVCMAMHGGGLLLLAYAANIVMVIGFASLHGMAWGLRGPLMSAIRADYFGRGSFGVILGFSTLITMFGNILGPVVAGVLADRTGNYELGFAVLACLAGAGSVFFFLAKKPTPPGVVVVASAATAAPASLAEATECD
jgi:sugar phosphate permease